jgi:hypothetical protein
LDRYGATGALWSPVGVSGATFPVCKPPAVPMVEVGISPKADFCVITCSTFWVVVMLGAKVSRRIAKLR